MKNLKLPLIVIVSLLAGYWLGMSFPLSSAVSSESIQGEAELKVTVKTADNNPVSGLEIDLGLQPGAPPEGGIGITDEKGMARFSLKPGNYFLFFNSSNFPSDLEMPDLVSITVAENTVNEEVIFLELK